MSSTITTRDVLERAQSLVRQGPIPDACTPYCLGCTIARAKSQLDDEREEGIDDLTAWIQFANECLAPGQGFQEVPSDVPLVGAREVLRGYQEQQETQAACLRVFDEVLTQSV